MHEERSRYESLHPICSKAGLAFDEIETIFEEKNISSTDVSGLGFRLTKES